MSVVYDVLSALQSAGVGTLSSDLFGFSMPETPNNCIVVFPSGGYPRDKAGFLQYPSVMIHVRNTSSTTAEIKANSVISALHRIANTTINGTRYQSIYSVNEAVSLGKDDQQRETLSINFEITRS